MKKFATFDADGTVTGFYDELSIGLPDEAVEISEAQWADLVEFQGLRRWINGKIVVFTPLPPPPPAIEVPSVTLWERLTEAEAEQVNAAMGTQPFRTRQIFMTANTFRSDHELWPLLVEMATGLFGEERAAELLADPSELVANS